MRTYRELFEVAEFRAIFAAQFLTVVSASIGSLGLGTIVYDETAMRSSAVWHCAVAR